MLLYSMCYWSTIPRYTFGIHLTNFGTIRERHLVLLNLLGDANITLHGKRRGSHRDSDPKFTAFDVTNFTVYAFRVHFQSLLDFLLHRCIHSSRIDLRMLTNIMAQRNTNKSCSHYRMDQVRIRFSSAGRFSIPRVSVEESGGFSCLTREAPFLIQVLAFQAIWMPFLAAATAKEFC